MQINDEFCSLGVVPGRRQLIAQTGGNRDLGQNFVIVIEVEGFIVANVIGMRDRNRVGGGVNVAQQKIGEGGAAIGNQGPWCASPAAVAFLWKTKLPRDC